MLLLLAVIGRSPEAAGAETSTPFASNAGDYLIQNWQAEEGLPRNSITCLTQDRKGYLWMGTPEGLIRFDGVRFVPFEGQVSPALAQGWVQSLLCDDAGTLWVGTRRSGLLCCRDGVVMSGPHFKTATPAAIDSMAKDGWGNLWVTDGNGMLERLATNIFAPTTWLYKIAQGPMLFKLVSDATGNLWFYKQDTYGRLVDGQPTNVATYHDTVITLSPSRAGGMWISTGQNLRRITSGKTATTEKVVSLPFGVYGVSALHEDRSGTLWVGTTGNGLFRLRDGGLERVGKINHTIAAIIEDAEGQSLGGHGWRGFV